MIEPVDSLEITVVVDNVTDSLSSTPKLVETEFAGAWRRGMKWLGGKCLCCAAHGLSCLITVRTWTCRFPASSSPTSLYRWRLALSAVRHRTG